MGVDRTQVLLWGSSLGSGLCTHLCAKLSEANKAPGGLILQAPYRSIMAVARGLVGIVPVRTSL
eukprot:922000-Amorphochlora_amoeboformis.AAC.1